MSQLIEDTNATIEFSELPTIKGIPFQLRQLFINLINNSIKYKKQNETPIITVAYDKIKAKRDLTEYMKDSNQLYWVGTMNSIKQQAEEIVLNELIYT